MWTQLAIRMLLWSGSWQPHNRKSPRHPWQHQPRHAPHQLACTDHPLRFLQRHDHHCCLVKPCIHLQPWPRCNGVVPVCRKRRLRKLAFSGLKWHNCRRSWQTLQSSWKLPMLLLKLRGWPLTLLCCRLTLRPTQAGAWPDGQRHGKAGDRAC